MSKSSGNDRVSVLFVCHGNICRSPAAQGSFQKLVEEKNIADRFLIDSAGVASYHIGELPHSTTRKVAEKYGIRLTHRARLFRNADFREFHHILVMDRSNLSDVLQNNPSAEEKKKIFLYRKFDPLIPPGEYIPDVPDPYYGGLSGFIEVQEMMDRIARVFLEKISI